MRPLTVFCIALAQTNGSQCHAIGRVGDSPIPEAPPFRTLHTRYPIEDLAEASRKASRRAILHAPVPARPGPDQRPARLSGFRSGLKPEFTQRTTRTGIFEWESTFMVSLPRKRAETPPRPCDAMTITSQRWLSAVRMIAW